MGETVNGTLNINKAGVIGDNATTIRLLGGEPPSGTSFSPPAGQIWLGGNGFAGVLYFLPGSVNPGTLHGAGQSSTIWLSAYDASIRLGGNGTRGKISMYDDNKKEAIKLEASPGAGNSISVRDNLGNDKSKNVFACSYDGTYARIYLGAHSSEQKGGKPGYIEVRDQNGNDSIIIDGKGVDVRNSNIAHPLWVRAIEEEENIKKYKNVFACTYDKSVAALYVGSHKEEGIGKLGRITLRDQNGNDSIIINGKRGPVTDEEGDNSISVRDNLDNGTSKNVFACSYNNSVAALYVGAHSSEGGGKPGRIILRDKQGDNTIRLNGEEGDIILSNADCAEEFDISSTELDTIEPGSVMIIDNDGKLQRSSKPYDKRVAGVISGAGDFKPGIVLNQKISTSKRRLPLSLVGKVYCKVDADYARINIGDVLTTSSTPGHAMKAANRSKAFGAVIGKALHAIRNGRSLIPILIALQ